MCRIGAIKTNFYNHPAQTLTMLLAQQEGHDNSGFSLVMQDLGGAFIDYKDKPLLSLSCTQTGEHMVKDFLATHGFRLVYHFEPKTNSRPDLEIQVMPRYMFCVYDYPPQYLHAPAVMREDFLLDMRLAMRAMLTEANAGFVYSFWPDVLTLKEIGDPRDIATYFRLWEDDCALLAKNMVAQCRQNTNYNIVRYAAHPFFIQGYTLCANGENTFFSRNTAWQRQLHHGYIGFESDSQNFLYTLHYCHKEKKWPLPYYKHVITPLPIAEIDKRKDKDVLLAIRRTMAQLEINGPNTIIALLPDGNLITCCDSKKLRPVVVGGDENTKVICSEVSGLNAVLPKRDSRQDIYPHERELIMISPQLEVTRWQQ